MSIGHIGESGHIVRRSVEALSSRVQKVTEQVIHVARGVLFYQDSRGRGAAVAYKYTEVRERSYVVMNPPEAEEPVRPTPEEERSPGQEPSAEEGEVRQGEGKPAPVAGERFTGGAPPPRELLPEAGARPQGEPGGSVRVPPQAPKPSTGSAPPAPSPTPAAGRAQASPAASKSTPPSKEGSAPPEHRQLAKMIARLAEPLTPQERIVLLAMVKQASQQLQMLPTKEIFQKMMAPGEVLSPAARGFVEKMTLWELMLQKFSSNPNLPIRKELSEIKEVGAKVLLMGNKEEAQEKLEELLQGPLKSRLENLEQAVSNLPQKEETEVEQLLNRLVELSEVSEVAVPREIRPEKVPYPISLQFAMQVRTREEISFAIRALESGTKKDSTIPLVLIPLPWEKKGEGALAGGGDSIEKGRGGSKSERQAGQQAMVYIPAGKVFLGEPEQPKEALQLEGFLIGVVPITNLLIATWLNGLASNGRITVKSGKVFFDRHLLLLRTKEATFESQIETRVVGNTLYFGVEKGSEEHPIVHISCKGAELFCTDMNLQLPTEAEWERAAGMRGDKEKFRFGFSRDQLDPTLANYDRGKGRAGTNCTTPVGFYNGLHLFSHQGKSLVTKNAVSPWGCYDMSGNVYDWTQGGVAKGGSYLSTAQELHVAAGRQLDPNETYPDVGFRLALSV